MTVQKTENEESVWDFTGFGSVLQDKVKNTRGKHTAQIPFSLTWPIRILRR